VNGVRFSLRLKLDDFHVSPRILSLDVQRPEVRHTDGISPHAARKQTARL
jgi:hypothetical protein